MIRVRVELIRASDGKVEELARMYITNDASGSAKIGNYDVQILRGRGAVQLDRGTLNKRGRVREYPRLRYHVWHLVALALTHLEYGVLR